MKTNLNMKTNTYEVKLSADQHDLVIKALSQIPTGEARDLGDLFEKAKSHDVLNDFTA